MDEDDTDRSAGLNRASEAEHQADSAGEQPRVDPPRRPAPKLVVKIVGGPEDWDRAGGQTANPGSQVGEQLPTFDASFFDAVPRTPSVEADESFQPVAVTAGRGEDRTYGDFLGEPEPVELQKDDDPVVTPRTVGVVGAVHASSIGHIDTHVPPVMYDFEPDVRAAERSTERGRASRTRRRARIAGPVVAVAAVVIWVLVMAGSGRPSLNTAGSGNQSATGQTSTTAPRTKPTQAPPRSAKAATAPNTPAPSATDANAPLVAAGGPAPSVTPVTANTGSSSGGGSRGGVAAPAVQHSTPAPRPAPRPAPAPTSAPKPAPAPTSAPAPTPTAAPPATVPQATCAPWMQNC